MHDIDLMENDTLSDVYHKRNLICDEIMLALNCFALFDSSNYDDVSDFLWFEYGIYVDSSFHVYCPEFIFNHLSFYFERHLNFDVVIVILD